MFNKSKLYIFSTITVVLLFVASSFPIYSQTDCIDCDVESAQFIQKWDVELPQFPGCTLYVSYWLKKCEGSDIHYITDLSWGIQGGDCQALILSFVKFNPDGSSYIDWDELKMIWKYTYAEMALQLFEAQDPAHYPCPIKFFTVRAVNTYCSSLRIIYNLVWGPGGIPAVGIRCIERAVCDIDGCCLYTYEFCWNGSIPDITESVTNNAICNPTGPPVFMCQPQPGDLVSDSPCSAWCQ